MTIEETKKTCFVIAPIGEPESNTRRWSDQVLRYIIRPAVEPCGYKAVRADDIDEPGIITSQVIQRVVEEPLVIADLTERNPNVFYELAIRHAVRKPFIQIINERENIPFDVAATRTILIDIRDLDKVESAKKQIKEHINSLEEDPTDLETPISVSLDLHRLRQSEDPQQRSLADMLSILTDISNNLAVLDHRLTEQVMNAHNESNVLSRELLDLLHIMRRILRSSRDEHPRILPRRHRTRSIEGPMPDGRVESEPATTQADLTEDLPW